MIGDDWILGWILDGLAKRFGPAVVSMWIAGAAIALLLVAGVLFLLGRPI